MKKNKSFILFSCIVFFMALFWFCELRNIRINHMQIVESQSQKVFTAKYEDIREIALVYDGKENPVQGDTVDINLYDDSGKKIWNYKLSSDKIGENGITHKEDITKYKEKLKLSKGKTYSFECLSEGSKASHITLILGGDAISILGYYFFVCVLILVFVAFFVHITVKKAKSFYAFFAIMMVLLGILYNVTIKPLCVPDEIFHMSRSYLLGNYVLHTSEQTGNFEVPFYQSGVRRMDGLVTIEDLYHFYTDYDYGNVQENTTTQKYLSSAFPMPFYAFLPSFLGMTLARVMHLPYQFVICFGRLSNILFLALMAILAMRICPKLKNTIAAICLLPSVVWLCCSYSYDVWNISFCLLFVAYCFYIREKESGMKLKDIIILLMILVAFAPIKYVYVILVLTVLVIPFSQWKDKRLFWGSIISGVLLFAVMIIARGREVLNYLTTQNVDYRSVNGEVTTYTIGYVAHNFLDTVFVFFKTFYQNASAYLERSISGEFYNVYVPSYLMFAVFAIFMLVMVTTLYENNASDENEFVINKKMRIFSVIMIMMGNFVLYFAFLFLFTSVNQYDIGTIAGLHGRYFIPFYIFLPFALGSKKVSLKVNSFLKERTSLSGNTLLIYGLVVMNVLIIFFKFVGIAMEG